MFGGCGSASSRLVVHLCLGVGVYGGGGGGSYIGKAWGGRMVILPLVVCWGSLCWVAQ